VNLRERRCWDVCGVLFGEHGILKHIPGENGAERTIKVVKIWLMRVVVRRLFIEPGSP